MRATSSAVRFPLRRTPTAERGRTVGRNGTSVRTVAFVVNTTRIRDTRRFARTCQAAATAAGWRPVLLATTTGDRGAALTAEALAAGARVVVAAGGDGTVRACAGAMAGTGVPLAVLPRGTANLLARTLRLPAALSAALTVVFDGANRPVDLAETGSGTFAAMAGIGLDAAVVAATPRLAKHRLGWLGYAAAGAAHMAGRYHRFEVRLDGGPPLVRRARAVVVGNVGLLPGGFAILPDARVDDGLLDVGILAAGDPVGWALVAGRVLTASRRDDRHLQRHQARLVTIRSDTILPRQVDGEILAPDCSLTVTVRPKALLVRVPRPR